MTDYAYVAVLIYQLRLCLGHVCKSFFILFSYGVWPE